MTTKKNNGHNDSAECKSQQALMESEEKYRQAFNTSPDAGNISRLEDGLYVDINEGFTELTGFTREEVIGRTSLEINIWHDAADRHKLVQVLKEKGSYKNLEARFRRKDGSCGTGLMSARIISLKGASYIIAVTRDITERKQAEEEIKHARLDWENIFQAIGHATLILDREHRIISANRAAVRATGIKVEDLTGKKCYEVFHSTDKPPSGCPFEKLNITGQLETEEMIMESLGREYLVSCTPVFDETGHLEKVIHIATDITASKVAEKILMESEAKLKSIFIAAPVGIGLVENRVLLEVNDTLCRMIGYSRQELLGQNARILYPSDDDYEYVGREKYRQISHKGTGSVETRWLRKDGEIIHIILSSTPLDQSDLSKGVTFTALDITERKQAEEEKAKIEDQYRQAQKIEAIGQLAGGVAHDFNNMLNIILGYSQMALMKIEPSGPLHTDILEIMNAGKRSADLVRQLLAFARKQTVAPKVLDINDTVAGMLNMLRKLIGEDIDLLWMPAANMWPVKIDPAQVDQILANLAVNARDSISGVGKITIETGKAEFDDAYCVQHAGFVPGHYVLLAVSDGGCGMEKETLEKIFEPFFTTKEIGKGTGMGLATVYGIVKQNNGFINVYSEPGRGTTFKIYLPWHGEENAVIDEPCAQSKHLIGTETVLLVEDDEALLKMAKIMLEGLGYTVLASGTPGEAIRLAEEHAGEIHLLVTDVVMPEMSGRDLQKRISALRPDVKYLFMSGYTANVIAHRGILDEGVNFLQKPFHMEDLATRVRKALEKE